MKGLRGLVAIMIAIFVLAGCSGAGADKAGTPSASSSAVADVESPQPTAPEVVETASAPAEVASPSASETPQATEPPKATESPVPSPSANGEEKSTGEASAKPSEPAAQRITFSIVGNEEWGTIVDNEQVDLKDGDTASSVLKRVAKAHRLAYEIRGSGAMTYIEGIDGLYEFDNGPTSGWKFRVNGTVPDLGAGAYELNPGDRLEWIYVNSDELAASGEESAP